MLQNNGKVVGWKRVGEGESLYPQSAQKITLIQTALQFLIIRDNLTKRINSLCFFIPNY